MNILDVLGAFQLFKQGKGTTIRLGPEEDWIKDANYSQFFSRIP